MVETRRYTNTYSKNGEEEKNDGRGAKCLEFIFDQGTLGRRSSGSIWYLDGDFRLQIAF